MLRAASDGLDRGPHVLALRQEIPPRGQEIGAFDLAARVVRPDRTARAVAQDLGPYVITVAGDHRMRAAKVARFVRIQGGMDAAVARPTRPARRAAVPIS